jgi:uncharacterized membrane protein YfcA
MSHEVVILLFFVFLVVSTLFSMLGRGGGAFYVPLLLAVSVPFYVAAATSQVLIMVVSLSSMLVFAKAKMLDWKLVLLIEPPINLVTCAGCGEAVAENKAPLKDGKIFCQPCSGYIGA